MTDINLFKGIVTCIEDLTTSFKIGYNEAKAAGMVPLIAGYIPQEAEATPRMAAVLQSTGGAVDGQLPDQIFKAIQIINRAQDYMVALADALEIFTALHGGCCSPFPVIESGSDYEVMIIDAQAEPACIGQDDNGYFLFSTNYIWICKDAA